MLDSNTLGIIFLTCIPIFLYSYLVYFLVPQNFISVKRARRYFITGLMSPMLVFLVHFIFPEWQSPQTSNFMMAIFIYTFFQIAMLEEFTKYTVFWWVNKERHSERHDLPIAIMFYCMMVALGFAITENVFYLINIQRELLNQQLLLGIDMQINNELLIMVKNRSLKAVVAHMICGVIMGNFLAKAHYIKYHMPQNKITRYFYILMGILSASLFHGIYNYNLTIPDHIYYNQFLFVILIFGLIIGRGIIDKLINDSIDIVNKKKLNNSSNNET